MISHLGGRVGTSVDLKQLIRDVPDFPQAGVVFKDITPLLQNPKAFQYVLDTLTEKYRDSKIDSVIAIEARGFIFGAPLALSLDAAFVPVRKRGKLPYKTIAVDYGLEYGSATVELHEDGVLPGKRVLIIDDVLATGGTAAAAKILVEQLGGQIIEMAFLVELDFLNGREKLSGANLFSILHY